MTLKVMRLITLNKEKNSERENMFKDDLGLFLNNHEFRKMGTSKETEREQAEW